MFSPQELDLIASVCQDEQHFLQHIEQRGIPTVQLQAQVMALRAKAMDLSINLKKKELSDAKKAEEKA